MVTTCRAYSLSWIYVMQSGSIACINLTDMLFCTICQIKNIDDICRRRFSSLATCSLCSLYIFLFKKSRFFSTLSTSSIAMNSFSLRGKFLLTITIGAVALVAMFAFSLDSVSTLNQSFSQMRDVAVVGKMTSLEIAKDINYVSRLTRDAMLGGDLEKDIKQQAEIANRNEERFQQLDAMPFSSQEKRIIADAQKAAISFIANGRDVLLPLREVPVDERYKSYKDYARVATPCLLYTSRCV